MKRLVRPALGAVVLLALAATPALASHSHVRLLGNGQCVVLAESAGEDDVVLPLAVFDHNPNVDIAPTADAAPPAPRARPPGRPRRAQGHRRRRDAGRGNAMCANGIVND